MQTNELISIIVPVYNSAAYLDKCIESLRGQSYQNLEILLVDDGSTDESGVICDAYAKVDSRIRVLHKPNGGQATARNMALDAATGAYVGFVDSDDYIAPDMYELLYSAICRSNADISVCARYNVTGDVLEPLFDVQQPFAMETKEAVRRILLYDKLDLSPCDKLFKRELIGKRRFPAGYICEDVDFVFRTVCNASKIVHTGKPLYYYVQREGSTSHSKFSEKTMGLKLHHETVYNLAIERFPELKEEAEYHYYSRLIILHSIMRLSGYKGYHKKELVGEIRKACPAILKNRRFSFREKVRPSFIACGLLPLLDWCRGNR